MRINWCVLHFWHQQGMSLQVRVPAGPNHLLKGSHDLSNVPSALCLFARLLGKPKGGLWPLCATRTCVFVRSILCVCAQVSEVTLACVLWAFSCASALIFSPIPSSHTLSLPEASGLQHIDNVAGGAALCVCGGGTSHREAACSMGAGRGAGRELFRGAQSPGAESGGWGVVHQELKWCTVLSPSFMLP